MTIDFDETDKKRLAQLIVLLKKIKIELEGVDEILAAAQVVHWVGTVQQRVSTPASPPPAAPVPEAVAPAPAPKPVPAKVLPKKRK